MTKAGSRRTNPNKVNKDGYAPLALAVLFIKASTVDQVKALLQQGANPRVHVDGVPIRDHIARHVAGRTSNKKEAKVQAERIVTLLDAAEKALPPPQPDRDAETELKLLRRIAVDRAVPSPLLVYGDWLLERDIGWGLYLQAWLAAEKCPPGAPTQFKLEKNARTLMNRHAAQWLEPI